MAENRDDERRELDPPILEGLVQAVPQVEPAAELRERVLASIGDTASRRFPKDSAYVGGAGPLGPARWLAIAASLALAVGLAAYTG